MLLFLEIDGVLHPELELSERPCLYTSLPLFEKVARVVPGLQIVITSDRRKTYSLAELKLFFSGDVAAKIVDVTPQLRDHPTLCRRESEIEKWLELNGRTGEKWVALDDKLYLYRIESELECIVATNEGYGLTKLSAQKLLHKLQQIPHTLDLFDDNLP